MAFLIITFLCQGLRSVKKSLANPPPLKVLTDMFSMKRALKEAQESSKTEAVHVVNFCQVADDKVKAAATGCQGQVTVALCIK